VTERVRQLQRQAYADNEPETWAALYQELMRTGFVDGIEGQAGLFAEWIPVLAVLGDPAAKMLVERSYDGVMFDDPDFPGRRTSLTQDDFFQGFRPGGGTHTDRVADLWGYTHEYGKTFVALVSCAWVKAASDPGSSDRVDSFVRYAAEGVDIPPGVIEAIGTWSVTGLTPRQFAIIGGAYTLTDGDVRGYEPRLGYMLGVAYDIMAGSGSYRSAPQKPGQVALTLVKPWVLAGSPRLWDPTHYLDEEKFWKVRLP
jgi:hypothetical protein